METPTKIDRSYSEEFKYADHRNPYHTRLEKFSEFVMRDNEAEEFRGRWNKDVFNREGKLIAEVGSGYGHFMMHYCENNPDVNYVGIDYRFKRSFELAEQLEDHPTKNFRYLRAKGERISFLFGESELDELYYFFPDPWPKRRHNKKRLFQEPFLKAVKKALKPGGLIYVKTDHEDYFDWMENILEKQNKHNNDFKIIFKTKDLYNEHPDHFLAEFQTKFEKIFLRKEINIKGFVLQNLK
ncbi:MAG: tRNA (guanosine(46)-N7)-methyltransferase TrmB [Bacteriovoracaceae bacterium]|jgi:tRNA (guanine-N7-)-methyltransferase|nr:tRNA (guanosine(46)-N7)-methyltransferase TrmB [Bacteriovoracaceae bacterium]